MLHVNPHVRPSHDADPFAGGMHGEHESPQAVTDVLATHDPLHAWNPVMHMTAHGPPSQLSGFTSVVSLAASRASSVASTIIEESRASRPASVRRSVWKSSVHAPSTETSVANKNTNGSRGLPTVSRS